tara:strand:+ start:1762 stop:2028 length:267 start_codon:yes stop_codon:yes gene_type:complete
MPRNGVESLMEEDGRWEMFRRVIIVLAILLLILTPIFLYIYLERGSEGFTDWFFNGIIGLMVTGFLVMFVIPQFEKLYHKLYDKLFKG